MDQPTNIEFNPNLSELAESELENLAGFDSGSSAKNLDHRATQQAGGDDLLDPEDFHERTETPIWSNPLAKAGLVGGIGLAGVFVLAGVLGSLHFGKNHARTHKIDMPEEEPLIANPLQEQLRQREAQVGELKTDNALGNQAQALALEESRQNFSGNPRLASPPAEPKAEPVPQVITTPVRPTPAPRPTPTPAPAPRPAASPTPAPKPTPPDPQQQWQNLSQVGSYGSMSVPERIPSGGNQSSPVQSVAQTGMDPQPVFVSQVTSQVSGNDLLTNFRYQADEAAILGIPQIPFVVINPGTTAQATLTSPIFWAEDLLEEDQSQRVGLELSEPMAGADGQMAIPAGAQMVARVDSVSTSGLVELLVISVLIPDGEGFKEIQLPDNTFSIQGGGGEPLLASEHDGNSSEIRNAELQLGVLGALGNVGEILVRPESSTTVTTSTSSISSTENGTTNILGGVIEGAADAIIDSRQDRLDDQIARFNSRSPFWYVETGSAIQVFVNQQTSFQTGGL